MIQRRIDPGRGGLPRLTCWLVLAAFALPGFVATPAAANDASWNDYLDHAYVYSAADVEDLRQLLGRTTAVVGRSLSEYHAETFPALAARKAPIGERQIRRKAIAELLLYRTGELPGGIDLAAQTISTLADRLDRNENRYWYHMIQAHQALSAGNAEAFVDQMLSVWLEVITPLEVPFETYKTLALTENGNSGFVRTLPHLYESISRMILIQSQTAALDRDIDSLAAIVRILTDERVGADPDAIPIEATSKAFLDHVVARLDGPESDGGSLSYTLALVAAERTHQLARKRLAEDGFSDEAHAAVRDSVSAYQRAMRNANTLQGQVAIYTRALRQLGEVFSTGEREQTEVKVDIPFSIERALTLYETLHAAKDVGWERHGYVDQGRDAYLEAMQGLWAEIQDASFNAARYYMALRNPSGAMDDESIVHAMNHYSRYLHAFERFDGDPTGESLPNAAYFGAYLASRGIGDGVLFFDGGDASVDQLEEAIDRYTQALGFFPFDRELWATLAVALQRSGREGDFLAVATPVARQVVHSRHLDRWINNRSGWAGPLESFRNAFGNDRSLVYFGFADEEKLTELETEFTQLQRKRDEIGLSIASTRRERDDLYEERREAHRLAAIESGEENADAPRVAAPPRSPQSQTIAQLGLDLERLSSNGERLEVRIDAIAQSLPIFKATLGHDQLIWELTAQRDHPVHELLRRIAEETAAPVIEAEQSAGNPRSEESWRALQSWIGGTER
ncbi:MAG: hypothetical protein CL908_27215 [Deltaproteobacteria bacterium]|nr:hypothetical protein [Deltaproteobacteria bacterium]